MTGANATITYLASRVESATSFTPTIQPFIVNQARLDGIPQLNMTTPLHRNFKVNTEFTVREGSGNVTALVAFLAEGACGLTPGQLNGQISLFEAKDRSCGYVSDVLISLYFLKHFALLVTVSVVFVFASDRLISVDDVEMARVVFLTAT